MLSSRWIKKEKFKVQVQSSKSKKIRSRTNDSETKPENPKSLFDRVSDFYVWMLRWSMRIAGVVNRIAVLASNVLWFRLSVLTLFPGRRIAVSGNGGNRAGDTLPRRRPSRARRQEIRALPGVIDTLTTVGSGNDDAVVNTANVYVKLADIATASCRKPTCGARPRNSENLSAGAGTDGGRR